MGKVLRRRSKTASGTLFHLRTIKVGGVSIRIDAKGYPVFKSGPLRDMRVHRAVASAMMGRDLTQDEDVHHRDGNKFNFDPDNLRVTDKAEHGWKSAIQHFWVTRVIEERERRHWEEWFDEE